MDRPTVLIAGFSGRALAQSARRAGYVPLVADGFGDDDMRAAAAAHAVLPGVLGRGFRAAGLVAALDRLAEAAVRPPVGLVLGSGFEDAPDLVAELERRYRLIGCTAETVRRAKDPIELDRLLTERGIPHPETRPDAPDDRAGWLSKRTGGTGGTHISRLEATPRPAAASPGAARRPAAARGRYVQREVAGTAVSALGIVGGSDCAFAFSRQWTAPRPRQPFRFGGATGSIDLDPDLEARMIETGLEVARALSLVGLVSLDFLIAPDQTPLLLEINPRPGATLDVFDDARGTLFEAHVAAGLGAASLADQFAAWSPPVARAAAYLYADLGALAVPALDWPAWTADRPGAGRRIGAGDPIATVIAEGRNADEAEAICRDRLVLLGRMLYEDTTGKETQP